MGQMFDRCKSLSLFPDISKWNIDKVTNMNGIFMGCESLFSLPDISKWNMEKVLCIDRIFNECLSLQFLPDISKWNLSNLQRKNNNVNYILKNCFSLIKFPKLKWN